MLITNIWAQQPGEYFCLATKSASGKFKDHFFTRADFSSVREFLKEHENDNVYFCAHGFKQARRTKEHAVAPHLLWADLDAVNPDEIEYPPTIVILSSPGRYAGLWMTDRPVTEQLNRRLTYAFKSDKSGWDLTQLLRAPGSVNHKYASSPRVRARVTDRYYTVEMLDKALPQAQAEVMEETDASKAFKQWGKLLRHTTRARLIQRDTPPTGKRSEVVFSFINEMIEAGIPQDAGLAMIRASKWNKYEGHDKQLVRSWERAVNKHFDAPKKSSTTKATTAKDEDEEYHWLSKSLAEVEEVEIDWVWHGWLARGEITILQGDPGEGKSFLAQNIAGHIISGKRLPQHQGPTVTGPVVYFDAENRADAVTKARMVAGGYGPHLGKFYQEEEVFSIGDDEALDAIRAVLQRIRPVMMVFDTLNNYMGATDTDKGTQTQQVFSRFARLVREFNCAGLVLRHLTKGARDRAMYRGQGSIAFTGTARIEMTVGRHPDEDDVRVCAMSKQNLTQFKPSFGFEMISIGKDKARFEFGDEYPDITADQIVSRPQSNEGAGRPAKAREKAEQFLIDELKDGKPHDIAVLLHKAEARSIDERTLRRAAKLMNLTKRTKGFGANRVTFWCVNDSV